MLVSVNIVGDIAQVKLLRFPNIPNGYDKWVARIRGLFEFSLKVFTEFSDNIIVKNSYSNLQPLVEDGLFD